ncbi:hypothetical protein [Aquitalea denitrificans]|uniref:hypothetical protein n=1 Tax=Aquitalea denitrificans TaxID=519081 RepID=UPI00135C2362|nr:hypothetical protein [Aquitalea denitrificans]
MFARLALMIIVVGVNFFAVGNAWDDWVLYSRYHTPHKSDIKYSTGTVQYRLGKRTDGNSGILLGDNHFYYCAPTAGAGYSSCSLCFFKGRCDEPGRADFADKVGSRIKLGWVGMSGIKDRVVFFIEVDGVVVVSYDSAVLKYEAQRQKARYSTVNDIIFIIFAVIVDLMFFIG